MKSNTGNACYITAKADELRKERMNQELMVARYAA